MRRYSALRKFLRHANRPAGTLTYHQLQGFLFAVGSAPELVRPSEWLPLVFNDQEAVYESMDEARTILGEIMRLYNEVNAGIFEERAALPPDCRFRKAVLDNLDESAPVCQWAHGFLVGHQWLQDLWEVDLSEDLDQELGAALLALSFFASRKLAEAFRAEQAPDKSLESLAESIRSVFPDALVSYAQLGRGLGSAPHGAGPDVPPGRPRASVGRNAPCPCGSGRKFKKCCGASVH